MLTSVLIVTIPPRSVLAARLRPAPWGQQLAYLQHLVLQTSNINLVRGLNLSLEQTLELQRIAQMVERLAGPTKPHGRLEPRVRGVASAYEELLGCLRTEEEVPDAMVERVIEARRTEVKLLREGLRYDAAASSCLRCHASPGTPWSPRARWSDRHAYNTVLRTDMDTSHCKALLGLGGLTLVWAAAEDVDKILTPAQLAAVEKFSCCLTPSRESSDPTRIGQVVGNDRVVRALEKTRRVPWFLTFLVQRKAFSSGMRYARLVNPGLTARDGKELRRRIRTVLSKTRRMSSVDFEIEKHSLAKELIYVTANRTLPPQVQSFKRALLLLVPGASRVYQREVEKR